MKDDATLVSKAWYALITANTFAFIVTLTANDSSYYQVSSTWNLPLINVKVTLVQFAFITPFLLLWGQLYQLTVFRRIKRAWNALPDDQRTQQQIDLPWIVAGVLENPEGTSRSDAIETSVKRLIFFWYGAAIVVYFWARFVRFHDFPLAAYHVGVATIATSVTGFITREGRRPTPAVGTRKLFETLPMFLVAVLSTALGLGALTSAAWSYPGQNPLAMIGVPTTLNFAGVDFSSALHVGSDGSKYGIDFGGRDLRGANFSRAILPWANFEKARLDRATFESANLQGANLVETSITDADFESADLRNDARLAMALGPRASFKGAKAQAANFHGARLCGANFDKSEISGIDLADANLTSASFVDTDMNKAGFAGASLLNADIAAEEMTGVAFADSDMCGAKVNGVTQMCTPDPQQLRPQGTKGWPTVCRDAFNDKIRP